MRKRILIISPHFPPLNAADMQRVRMSLPYFAQFGYDAEVVTVVPRYSQVARDELLLQSIPENIKIYQVKAFDKRWTSKLGLGSLALRSLWFYRRTVNKLLQTGKYDLVYFSTTEFPICILGAYWKKRFGVPYVIDMQDPWHSDYYRDKPTSQRPKKYWFSYRLNKYLEPVAMRTVSGLISVSEAYLSELRSRYAGLNQVPSKVITFGAFAPDLAIAIKNSSIFPSLLDRAAKNLVYVGRGGGDMEKAIVVLLKALAKGLEKEPEKFGKLKCYFIGTSYAPAGQGKPTAIRLAEQYRLQQHVVEQTKRISFYHTLTLLQQADGLFIPGSDDARYTASKIYPYLLARKPLLTIFHPHSPAIPVLKEFGAANRLDFASASAIDHTYAFLADLASGKLGEPDYDPAATSKYSAENMTRMQCELFDQVITGNI